MFVIFIKSLMFKKPDIIVDRFYHKLSWLCGRLGNHVVSQRLDSYHKVNSHTSDSSRLPLTLKEEKICRHGNKGYLGNLIPILEKYESTLFE